MSDLTGRSNTVDRIAVLVSYGGTTKFLGAPKIHSGTGQNIAHAVYSVLVDWCIAEKVVAASFDTTSTNSGKDGGALAILNDLLGRKLIELPCRHHIHEIALKNVFDTKFGSTSAPETLIFNRFEKAWEQIKHNQFTFGLNDAVVKSAISNDEIEQIKQFCCERLEHKQIRGDYRELLELSLTFLGGDGGNFRACGATSHARFMSKCIYSLKMFLFRNHFTPFTPRELRCIRDICIFVVKFYIKFWFGCTSAIKSPNQDLHFVREAFEYEKTDKNVSEALTNKFKNHLWYLSPEKVALSFFDSNVSIEMKRKMVNRLKEKNPVVTLPENRKHSNSKKLLDHDLSDFVSYRTRFFFSSFDLQSDFLELDPSEWENNEEYETAFEFCQNLFVDNDAAERGVKFMKDYNRVLTRDEEELQFILQVVDSYRAKYPFHTKSSLTN